MSFSRTCIVFRNEICCIKTAPGLEEVQLLWDLGENLNRDDPLSWVVCQLSFYSLLRGASLNQPVPSAQGHFALNTKIPIWKLLNVQRRSQAHFTVGFVQNRWWPCVILCSLHTDPQRRVKSFIIVALPAITGKATRLIIHSILLHEANSLCSLLDNNYWKTPDGKVKSVIQI